MKERRTRDDPAGRRRDCVGDRNRQPTGDAIPPRAARPAVMNVLSAPVFRLGLRALARGRDSLEFGFNEVAQGSVLLIGNRLEPCFQVGIDQDIQVSLGHVALI